MHCAEQCIRDAHLRGFESVKVQGFRVSDWVSEKKGAASGLKFWI